MITRDGAFIGGVVLTVGTFGLFGPAALGRLVIRATDTAAAAVGRTVGDAAQYLTQLAGRGGAFLLENVLDPLGLSDLARLGRSADTTLVDQMLGETSQALATAFPDAAQTTAREAIQEVLVSARSGGSEAEVLEKIGTAKVELEKIGVANLTPEQKTYYDKLSGLQTQLTSVRQAGNALVAGRGGAGDVTPELAPPAAPAASPAPGPSASGASVPQEPVTQVGSGPIDDLLDHGEGAIQADVKGALRSGDVDAVVQQVSEHPGALSGADVVKLALEDDNASVIPKLIRSALQKGNTKLADELLQSSLTGVVVWPRDLGKNLEELFEKQGPYGNALATGIPDLGARMKNGEFKNFEQLWGAATQVRRQAGGTLTPDHGRPRGSELYKDDLTTPITANYLYVADRVMANPRTVRTPTKEGGFIYSLDAGDDFGTGFLVWTKLVHGKEVVIPGKGWSHSRMFHGSPVQLASERKKFEDLYQDALAESDPQLVAEKAARLYWRVAHMAPDIRGSAAKIEIIYRSIFAAKGLPPPPLWKPGVSPDIEAMLRTEDEWLKDIPSLTSGAEDWLSAYRHGPPEQQTPALLAPTGPGRRPVADVADSVSDSDEEDALSLAALLEVGPVDKVFLLRLVTSPSGAKRYLQWNDQHTFARLVEGNKDFDLAVIKLPDGTYRLGKVQEGTPLEFVETDTAGAPFGSTYSLDPVQSSWSATGPRL